MFDTALGEKKKKKSKATKKILQIVFFAVLTLLAIYYILKDDPKQTFEILSSAQLCPTLWAVLVICASV